MYTEHGARREVLLQKDAGHMVVLEDGGAVVRKTYLSGDPEELSAQAAREFNRISIFRAALRECAGAACPAPVEFSSGPPPYIRMTRAAGIPMEDCLTRADWSTERFDAVGGVIGRAASAYARTFGEPYWDFILRNMLYAPLAQLVTFVDYEIPPSCRPLVGEFSRFSPLDFTLGTLVAAAVFEARRPKKILRQRGHRQAAILVRAVLRSFRDSSDGPELEVEQVREVARIRYGMDADVGGPIRRGWYRSATRIPTAPGAAIDDICAGE